MKNGFANFADFLARYRPCLWWRDDDVAYEGWWHPVSRVVLYQRTRAMLDLLAAYPVPTFLAVVPHKFLQGAGPLVRLLEEYPHIPLAIHGLRHKSRVPGPAKNEFPPDFATGRETTAIMVAYNRFRAHFRKRVLPVFVPPFNSMSPSLARQLEDEGLVISASNPTPFVPESCNPHHIDYDFVDWQRRKVKPHGQILSELTQLVATGRPSIGINGHHKILTCEDRAFFARLFYVICTHADPQKPWPFATETDA